MKIKYKLGKYVYYYKNNTLHSGTIVGATITAAYTKYHIRQDGSGSLAVDYVLEQYICKRNLRMK